MELNPEQLNGVIFMLGTAILSGTFAVAYIYGYRSAVYRREAQDTGYDDVDPDDVKLREKMAAKVAEKIERRNELRKAIRNFIRTIKEV